MARYLIMADYTVEGAKGLLKAGGASRRDTVAQTCESVGGRMESFDFAFGEHDAYVLVDLPDHAAAAKVALAVNAAGGAHTQTIVLISPDELPGGSGADVSYTAPGA